MQMFQPYMLALLLLTPISGALAQTDLFGYDAKAPLDYQQKLLEERDGIKIFDASYAGSKGGRIPVYVVVPSGKGPFRIVVPGEKKPARWIWEVTSMTVRFAKE